MASVSREYDDDKIAEGVEGYDKNEVLGYHMKAEVQFSPPVSNGLPTATITITKSYTIDRAEAEAILERSH